jgi:hypothetical protein
VSAPIDLINEISPESIETVNKNMRILRWKKGFREYPRIKKYPIIAQKAYTVLICHPVNGRIDK